MTLAFALSDWLAWPPRIGLYLVLASLAATQPTGRWSMLWRLPAVIAAFHVGYGWGTWQGLMDVVRARAPSSQFAKMTR